MQKRSKFGSSVILISLSFLFSFLSESIYAETGSVLFWNKLGSKDEIANSEIGPGIQLTSYKIADWEQAQILPAQFGDGLFVNQSTDEGWANDGGNFFAVNLNDAGVTPEKGTIEFWFSFKYDSSVHNHALFFGVKDKLSDHFRKSKNNTNVWMNAGWNGWDYGSYGKRFWFAIGHASDASYAIAYTPDFSAAPGGQLEFNAGTVFHLACAWDINGIDGTQDTIRLYVNGNMEASDQTIWTTTGGFDPYLYLGSFPNYGSIWDHYYNAVKGITDNFIIWSDARTDFSHRFNEDPTSITFSELSIKPAILKFNSEEKDSDDRILLHCSFVLNDDSDGVNPMTEDLTVTVDNYSFKIPAGSFSAMPDGHRYGYKHDTPDSDPKFFVELREVAYGEYDLDISVRNINLAVTVNPLTIGLVIGNDSGMIRQNLKGMLDSR